MIKSFEFSAKTIDAAVEKGLAELHMERDDVSLVVLQMPKNGFFGIGAVDARVQISYDDGKPEPKPEAVKKPEAEKKSVSKPVFNVSKEKLEKLNEQEKPSPRAAEKKEEKKPATGMAAPYLYEKIPASKSEKEANEARKNAPAEKKQGQRRDRRDDRPRMPKAPAEPFVKKPVPEDAPIPFLIELLSKMNIEANAEIRERSDDRIEIALEGPNMGKLIGRHGETMDALQYIVSLAYNRSEEGHTRIVIDTENYREKREHTLAALARRMADNALRQNRAITLEPMSPTERRIIHTALQGNEKVTTFSTGTDPNRRVVISPVGINDEHPLNAERTHRGHRGGHRRYNYHRRNGDKKPQNGTETPVSSDAE